MVALVSVNLLGGFEVFIDKRQLDESVWRRRKARQLFKYLLSRPHRVASREQAVETLWPEGDPSTGAANLRSIMTGLRHALEPAEVVVSKRDSVGLRGQDDL